MDYSNDILKKIKQILDDRGWSVYKLAKESDITYSSLGSMFAKNTYPTLPTLEKICKGLNISISDFFEKDHPVSLPNFTPDEYELIDIYRKIPERDKKVFLAYANGFAHRPLV